MSRKYRQRGYQDDEPHDSRRSSTGPRERSDGPRGRGLGRPTETVFRCARCGNLQDTDVSADSTCQSCSSDLHTCTNCRQFDSAAPNECLADIETRIAGKASRNDCDLFEPKVTQEVSSDKAEPDDPRSEFDSLFNF